MQKEILDYLAEIVCPPEGVILVTSFEESLSWDHIEECSLHGIIGIGSATSHVEDIWRVLKPGAFCVIIPLENFDYRSTCAMEDFGFEVRDAICLANEESSLYYIPKPAKTEKDAGCSNLPTRQQDLSRREDQATGNNPYNRGGRQRSNFHPTVKPIKLGKDLVKDLPPRSLIVEPFIGSGSFLVSFMLEGHHVIGIEKEIDYAHIAQARAKYWNDQQPGWNTSTITSNIEEKKTSHTVSSFLDLVCHERLFQKKTRKNS